MPFVKGQSGNPAGRPKSNLGSLLSKFMQESHGEKTREQWLIERVWAMGAGGNLEAIKFIWERLEGRIMPASDVSTNSGELAIAVQKAIDEDRKSRALPPLSDVPRENNPEWTS